MDYYETIAKIDQDIKDQEELDNYLENQLEGFEWVDIGSTYLHVKAGSFDHTFKLNDNTTVESLKKDIKKALKTKIDFYQNILDRI
jgi:hypothetical protein